MMTNAMQEYPMETAWQHRRRIRRMCTKNCRAQSGVVRTDGTIWMALAALGMWTVFAVMFVRLWV